MQKRCATLYFYKDNPAKVKTIVEETDAFGKEVTELLAELQLHIAPERKLLVDNVVECYKIAAPKRKHVCQLALEGKWDEYAEYRTNEYEPSADALKDAIGKYIDVAVKFVFEFIEVTSDEMALYLDRMLLTVAGISIAVLIILSIIIIAGITKALHKAVEAANHVANGNIDVDLTATSKDETGILMDALSTMVNSIKRLISDGEKLSTAAIAGQLEIRADADKHKGAYKELINGTNKIIDAIVEPINDTGVVLGLMATGDLTPRIMKDYPGKFGEMKSNINNLGDSLTDLISQLQESIHTTASASAEISATAETLASATQEQSSQTDEVAGAVEEMSRTVTENANGAVKTAEVAQQSGEVANVGGKVVQQTVAKMREISDVVKTSAENILKLGESSKKIGEIIGVIDDIADQTNLLSLNAAIEAARAGEQGRGFAVVADSVGKLAISTAGATKEIADMIKGIQAETEAAVKAMEKGTSEVENGIVLADKAGSSLENILTNINVLLDMVNQIASASEEQSATSEEIAKNVSSISKVTAESAKNLEDVASTANELAKMTETLTSLVSQFKVNVSSSYTSKNRTLERSQKNDRYLE
jgi:methyl-accepting chemotaxis protein